jgi:hypothetical protein
VSAPVGADIEAICGKCGEGWHVVVAKIGEQIVKVLCKHCGRQHRFRSADAPARPPRSRSASADAPRRTGAARAVPPAPPSAPAVEYDPQQPPRPYRPADLFRAGERILHPTFGVGVVEVASIPGKMQVFFSDGRRTLVQAKPASALEPRAATGSGDEEG